MQVVAVAHRTVVLVDSAAQVAAVVVMTAATGLAGPEALT
jgi:hypothetical protein